MFSRPHENAVTSENGIIFDDSMRIYWYPTQWRNRFQKPPFSSIHRREVTNGAFPWPQAILKQLEEWHVIVSCDQFGETARVAPTLLPSTRVQQNGVLKTLQSGEQFWKDEFSVTVSTGSVWTGEKREKKSRLRFQTKTNTCGRSLKVDFHWRVFGYARKRT